MAKKYEISKMPFCRTGAECVVFVPTPVIRKNGRVFGPCTSGCTQFINYSCDARGYRIIPADAKCPHMRDKPCQGGFFVENGNFVTGITYRNESYQAFEYHVLMDGLGR